MTVTLGTGSSALVLVAGQERNSDGDPVGPENLDIRDERGVERREYVGADGMQPEWIKCDARFVSFDATRVFATEAAALAYMAGSGLGEGRMAAAPLVFAYAGAGGTEVQKTVMSSACIARRTARQCGVAVAVHYEIEGY